MKKKKSESELEKFAREAREQGKTYGQLQAEETLQRNRWKMRRTIKQSDID